MQDNVRSFGCNYCSYQTAMSACPKCRAIVAYEWIELRRHPFLRWVGACLGLLPLAVTGMAVMGITTNSDTFRIGGFIVTYIGLLIWWAKTQAQ
jgi:hypothetical protein